MVLETLFGMFPFLKKLFADGGYQGPQFQKALARILPQLMTAIVKRSDRAKGFEISSAPLGCRTYFCMAQPLPQTCQRLGKSHPQRLGLLAAGFHPPYAAKAKPDLLNGL